MMRIITIVAALVLIAVQNTAVAQERKLLRQGNDLYKKGQYKEAVTSYQQALQQNPASSLGKFNLGNALYQQKSYEPARKSLADAAKNTKDVRAKSGANYNIGNTYMAEQKWQDAINAYKETLRRNPADADAKYNLSYATEKLKQQQQNDKNNKDNKDKKDQKKDDKNKDKKDDKKDQKKDGDQKDKGDKDEQEKQPQSQPSKLSEQQAEQMLKALQQEEKKVRDKKQKASGSPVQLEKDW